MSKDKYEAKVRLSKDVIKYFHDTVGDTYKQIGQKIGLSESFIYRVQNGERNLTLEHLVKLERAYKIPLPVVLLEVTTDKNVPKELKPLYKTARDLLKSASSLKKIFQIEL